jgi:hypothetical protein
MKDIYKTSVENSEEKRALGKTESRWEDYQNKF